MAKGSKTGGRDFKPGQSGNPRGRPPTPEDIKLVKRATIAEFDQTLAYLANLPADEVAAIAKDLSTPVLLRALAKTLYLASRSGDPRRLGVVLDRMHGRPGQLRADEPIKRTTAADLSDEELDRKIEALGGKRSSR